MSDVVVTVPKSFGLQRWIEEGDPVGAPWSGTEWGFFLGYRANATTPGIAPGERVYIVYNGKLRGYAPLVRVARTSSGIALVRRGDAVAVTIREYIKGFQGFRYRWWNKGLETPFPDWTNP